jgi:hypothetical protein
VPYPVSEDACRAARVLRNIAAPSRTAIGVTIGSVIPGVGTGLGGAIGLVVGMALSVSVDMALLAAEEKLTRDGMRNDLVGAVTESLQPFRETFECGAAAGTTAPVPTVPTGPRK